MNEILNKTGKCPAIIHTDQGGKFSSKVFLSQLEKLGVRIEAGPANSPQTNGLAERFNQTILVKIRCLLVQSLVPINYWDEAAHYALTLINVVVFQTCHKFSIFHSIYFSPISFLFIIFSLISTQISSDIIEESESTAKFTLEHNSRIYHHSTGSGSISKSTYSVT
jgi:transposase InsO family protein